VSDVVVAPDLTATPLSQLISLAGKRAVVTGGAKGIGERIAFRLAEAGAAVIIGDIDVAGAEGAASAIAAATGSPVEAVALDVTDTASIAAAADRAVAAGGLHIWVNNAGIFPTTGDPLEVTDEFVDRMLEVNVRGTYVGAREAAKRMSDGGVIINLASTAGFKAGVGISAYVASKHAVVGITKNLGVELGPRGIRVLGLAPTVIVTPGVTEQMAPLKAAGLDIEKRMAANPLGRGGVPDDIARVALFCASDLSAYMTGSVIPVDAGALA
jgi:NAD(P)-dependent dehydrogenase (short-subunit alcohol dehydrogenase family)